MLCSFPAELESRNTEPLSLGHSRLTRTKKGHSDLGTAPEEEDSTEDEISSRRSRASRAACNTASAVDGSGRPRKRNTVGLYQDMAELLNRGRRHVGPIIEERYQFLGGALLRRKVPPV